MFDDKRRQMHAGKSIEVQHFMLMISMRTGSKLFAILKRKKLGLSLAKLTATSTTSLWVKCIVILATLFSFVQVSALNGEVTFYNESYFGGTSYVVKVTESQKRYNLGSFDNEPASVKWKDLPLVGNVNHKTYVSLYQGESCSGKNYHWATKYQGVKVELQNFQNSFGLYHTISSFMFWETSKLIESVEPTACKINT